jgi:signal peptide peptidase SppA
VSDVYRASLTDYFSPFFMELGAFEDLRVQIRRVNFVEVFAAPPPRNPGAFTTPGENGKSVAQVPIRGTMMKGVPFFGGTSTALAGQAIRQAAADPNVSGILLHIDSPGGTVAGTADLAREVRDAKRRKPVWAHVADMAASAAYWVASQADQIYANAPTALVGSIGTVLTVYDQSAAAEAQGIKPHVFATGPLKGAGAPGTPVTEEHQSYFQGIVDAMQPHFDAAVRGGRGMSADELAAVRTGGVFAAPKALELKLIDGIRSFDRTLEALARAK